MDIEAFILIGGRSSRLGVDKAFVRINDETLASRAARVVASAISLARTTFIAASADQFGAKRVSDLELPVIYDLKPGSGAWSGIYTALGSARTEFIFVLACDLPFISPALLRVLVESVGNEFDAVVPRQQDGRLQPLCCVYRRKATLAVVEVKLAADDDLPPLVSIFEHLKRRVVEPDEYDHLPGAAKFFTNINTPDDLNLASLDEAADTR